MAGANRKTLVIDTPARQGPIIAARLDAGQSPGTIVFGIEHHAFNLRN
jgi:hypothetical protein